jgi:capsular polysaccharide export protein
MIGVFSSGILGIPFLASFLEKKVRRVSLVDRFLFNKNLSAIAGWGLRGTTVKARTFANRHGLPFISVEDGFLRSCGLGVQKCPPLSLVIDECGVYYDATQPSGLEMLIASRDYDPNRNVAAEKALKLIRMHRLSKYNHAPEKHLPRLDSFPSRVLVIDQTMGDVSVRLGGGDESTFNRMLAAAQQENPMAEIWVKTHPDVLAGKKKGYLGIIAADENLRLLAEDISPLSLLEQVDKVYVVTSQMGFEALMLGKPVVCFGLPWYAGWSLTDDRHPGITKLADRRNVKRSLHDLFSAAYLEYARYIEPATGAGGTIFDVIDWLSRNKDANDATRGELWCIGMSLWKKAVVLPFLESASTTVHFISSPQLLARRQLGPDAKVVVWGIKNEKAVQKIAADKGVPVWHMEDGFLRSVGLGSDLHRPVSLVLDEGGMYYDPASGSDLETILSTQILSKEDRDRAASFMSTYVSMRASKYNIAGKPIHIAAGGRRVLLVPGQVEDDASIQRGSPVVTGNLALLRTVREKNPDAYIVYKPHPDVVAGNRLGEIRASLLKGLVDECVIEANIIDCIIAADEVHTMTSQSGFEALMHGRVVHCYGGPFYAGWGLTVDHFALPHRKRSLSLDELVFAVMLKYPRYVLPGIPGLASAEQVLAMLMAQTAAPGDRLSRTGVHGWMDRKLRKMKAIMQLLRDGWRLSAL